jgi:hypothetical protein
MSKHLAYENIQLSLVDHRRSPHNPMACLKFHLGEAPETLHRRSAFDISQTADAQKAALRLFD